MKNNKVKLLISSIIIMLPALAGVLLWDKLPDSMAVHWGAEGQADGWGAKWTAVFLTPIIMLVIHWVCLFVTLSDKKNKNQTQKALDMVHWIMPAVSVYTSSMMYALALGMQTSPLTFTFVFMGVLFVVMGNYLPKCKQNLTIGIKISWTLNSEANWNATHRFAGKIWVLCGVVFLIAAFIAHDFVMYPIIAGITLAAVLPCIYSYKFYKKELMQGTVQKAGKTVSHYNKKVTVAMWVLFGAILVFCVIICFTGNIDVTVSETGFEINASYSSDHTVSFYSIDSIEYREKDDAGTRVSGFGSPRLSMGIFENDEFGIYTRYSYTKSKSCIVLKSGDNVLVIGLKDDSATQNLYYELAEKIK